ncbi:hypothetical protein BASA61_006972 [Batrachochytrium salamandrivorans]|nr:hypothetical protein BASA60_006548 [Batrachochytrium salamandrivorans]KAH6585244.1 hypothetical protein BASA61_006972 [Batrachochytrium salamandrivorans]KAH9273388.1 hypothetical protein BASA83_004391 [Batrachochytrium salamandrivorans]
MPTPFTHPISLQDNWRRAKHIATNLLLGLWLACDGTVAVLTSLYTRSLLLRLVRVLLLYSAICFFIVQLVLLPVTIARSITALFVQPLFGASIHRSLDLQVSWLDGWIRWWIFISPDAGLYFVRYLYPGPLDTLFFETLHGITASRSNSNSSSSNSNHSTTSSINRTPQFVLNYSQSSMDPLTMNPRNSLSPHNNHLDVSLDGIPMLDHLFLSTMYNPTLAPSAHVSGNNDPRNSPMHHGSGNSKVNDDTLSRIGHIQKLQSKPRRSLSLRMLSYLSRYSRRLFFFIVISLLSKLPLVGWMCWPAVSFKYFQSIFGWKVAAGMLSLSLVSKMLSRLINRRLLRATISFRALGRELLEPYLCRSLMTPTERHKWYQGNQLIIYGFTAAFYPFCFMPWIGPLVFAISQGAAARLCLEIFDRHDSDIYTPPNHTKDA